jgi:prevent-host-death family protein
MGTASSYEAKTHLAALLRRVQQGESITITKHGVPVAKLVPADQAARPEISELIAKMQELRKGHTLGGISIRELIEDGRRY